MKICIFGAGAIGGYLGLMLKRGEADVSLVARGAHLEAIRKNGLTLQIEGQELREQLEASDDPSDLGPQDYVIIGLKAHQAWESAEKIVRRAYEDVLDRDTAGAEDLRRNGRAVDDRALDAHGAGPAVEDHVALRVEPVTEVVEDVERSRRADRAEPVRGRSSERSRPVDQVDGEILQKHEQDRRDHEARSVVRVEYVPDGEAVAVGGLRQLPADPPANPRRWSAARTHRAAHGCRRPAASWPRSRRRRART